MQLAFMVSLVVISGVAVGTLVMYLINRANHF